MKTNNILLILLIAIFSIVAISHQVGSLPPNVLMFARYAFLALFAYFAYTRSHLTTWVVFSLFMGAELGVDIPTYAKDLDVLGKIFMKLIKSVVAPLLFGTLITGIAGHTNLKELGRMGLKTLLYFEMVTTLALIIGLVAINVSKAGEGIKVAEEFKRKEAPTKQKLLTEKQVQYLSYEVAKNTGAISKDSVAKYDAIYKADRPKQEWKEIVLHTFPENVAKSIADNEILQIVVFCIFFAIGLSKVKKDARIPIIRFAHALSEVMFKFTGIVMYFAPFGVGGAVAATVANLGIDVFKNLGILVLTLYIALFAFIFGVLFPIMFFLKIPIRKFIEAVAEPASLAFAAASSEVALPKALENMMKFGVSEKVVSFVIPTGYTFNLDGTTLYLSLASVFVAQAAGIEMSIGVQIQMVLMLMLTSKGVAAVPRASLVILTGTAASFGLPEWPIAAIFGIDALMDMARTSVNVIGNCLATVVIGKWEGEYHPHKPIIQEVES